MLAESFGKKMLTMVTGRKTPVGDLEQKWYVYPMEDVEETPDNQLSRSLVIIPRDEGRDEIVKRLSEAVKTGRITDRRMGNTWLAYANICDNRLSVSVLLLGDIVWVLVTSVFG